MKRILATLIVTCAVSASAFAGGIPTCGPTAAAASVARLANVKMNQIVDDDLDLKL